MADCFDPNLRNKTTHYNSKDSISWKGQRNWNKTEDLYKLSDFEIYILWIEWQSPPALKRCEVVCEWES